MQYLQTYAAVWLDVQLYTFVGAAYTQKPIEHQQGNKEKILNC